MSTQDTTTTTNKSIWQRFKDKLTSSNNTKHVSDNDLLKYTGKTRAQLDALKTTTPGVGPNQLAGTLAAGSAPGLGGTATAYGVEGWGPGAAPRDDEQSRGMKFPPTRGGAEAGDEAVTRQEGQEKDN